MKHIIRTCDELTHVYSKVRIIELYFIAMDCQDCFIRTVFASGFVMHELCVCVCVCVGVCTVHVVIGSIHSCIVSRKTTYIHAGTVVLVLPEFSIGRRINYRRCFIVQVI